MVNNRAPTITVKCLEKPVNTWWNFVDTNINISHSHLFKLNIGRKTAHFPNMSVHVFNSSFVTLHISHQYNVEIKQSYFFLKRMNEKLINISNSSIIILQTNFIGNESSQAAEILTASHSHAVMTNTSFHGIFSSNGLINMHKSSLFLKHVDFIKNGNFSSGSAIQLSSNSHVQVEESNFSLNSASRASCLYLSEGSQLSIANTRFDQNLAPLINCDNKSIAKFDTCQFSGNHFPKPPVRNTTGLIQCANYVKLTIQNSFFVNHTSTDYPFNEDVIVGGHFMVLDIRGSNFVNNSQHVIRTKENGTILVRNSTISQNFDVMLAGNFTSVLVENSLLSKNNGSVSVGSHSNMTLANSILRENSMEHSYPRIPALSCRNGSSVHIRSCTFVSNFAGMLRMEGNNELILNDSTFEENHATDCVMIKMSASQTSDLDKGTTVIQNCTFQNNTIPMFRLCHNNYGHEDCDSWGNIINLFEHVVIKNSFIAHNPGGVECRNCKMEIFDSIFLNNSLEASPSTFLQSSNFTQNTIGLRGVLVDCMFHNNTFTEIYIDRCSSSNCNYTVNNSVFEQNTGAILSGSDFRWINLENSVFIRHKVHEKKPLFELVNANALVRNCTFRLNDCLLFSVQNTGKIRIILCSISPPGYYFSDDIGVIRARRGATLTVENTNVLGGFRTFVKISEKSEAAFFGCHLWNRIVVDESSKVFFHNTSFSANIQTSNTKNRQKRAFFPWMSTFDDRMDGSCVIFANRSSEIQMVNLPRAVAHLTEDYTTFLCSDHGSLINISDMVLLTDSDDHDTNCFLRAHNSTLSITSSKIVSSYPSFPYGLMVLKGSNFKISDTNMSSVKDTFYKTSVMMIMKSNGTIDNCQFTNVALSFGSKSLISYFSQLSDFNQWYEFESGLRHESLGSSHITINNTLCDEHDPDHCLALLTGQYFYSLVVASSVLRIEPTFVSRVERIECPCPQSKESLRLYNSAVFVSGSPETISLHSSFEFSVSVFVTWNSTIKYGTKQAISGATDFIDKLKRMGLFWACLPGKMVNISPVPFTESSSERVQASPKYANSLYASGEHHFLLT